MSNKLIKEFIRRIEKILTGNSSTRPDIPPVGTNHIDDPNDWTDNSIYKGEIALNVGSNNIFTSDGKEQINLGREDVILEGLVLSTSGVSLTELNISSGSVRIKGRDYYFDSTTDIDDGSVSIEPNIELFPRLDIVAVTKDLGTFNSTKNMYGVKFQVFKGEASSTIPTRDIPEDYIYIGCVLVYPNQTVSDVLRPRSFSLSNSTYPLFPKSPKTHIEELKSSVETWKPNTLYFKDQILRFDGNMYQVSSTFVSLEDIQDDIDNGNIIQLGNLSSSNITRFSHVGVSPTDGNIADGFFENWTSTTRLMDAFDNISTFIRRISPKKPSNIANANLILNVSNYTAGVSRLGIGNVVTNVIDSNVIPEVKNSNFFTPSESGAVKSYFYTPYTSYSTNNLVLIGSTEHPPAQVNVITEASNIYSFTVIKDDPYKDVPGKQGFYYSLNVNIKTTTTVLPDSNSYRYEIKHFSSGANSNVRFYAESSRTPVVANVGNYKANVIGGNVKYLSGVPVLKANDRIECNVIVDDAVRYFYNNTKIIEIDSDVSNKKTANLSQTQYVEVAYRPPFTELANANSNSIRVIFSNVESNILSNSILAKPTFSITAYNAVNSNVTYTTPELFIPVDDVSVEVGKRLFSGTGDYPSGNANVDWGNTYTASQSMANIMSNQELQYFGGQYFYPNINYRTTIANVTEGTNNISYPNYTTTGNTTYRYATFYVGDIVDEKFYSFKIKDSVGLTYNLDDGVTLTNNLKVWIKVNNSSNANAGTGWLDVNKAYNVLDAEYPFANGDKALDLGYGGQNVDIRRATFGDMERTGNVYVRIGTNKKGVQFANVIPYSSNLEVSEDIWNEYNLGTITDESYVIVRINGTNGTLTSDFIDGITMTSDFYAQLAIRNESNSSMGTEFLDMNKAYPANGFVPVDYDDSALDLSYYTSGIPDPTLRKVTFGPTTRTGNVIVRIRKTGSQVYSNVTLIYPEEC